MPLQGANPTPSFGGFGLNPNPDLQGFYAPGITVTIDVLVEEGWKVEKWVGPVYDAAEETAKIDMDSSHTVALRLVRTAPTPTPTSRRAATPTLTPVPSPPTPTTTAPVATPTPLPRPRPTPTPTVKPRPAATATPLPRPIPTLTAAPTTLRPTPTVSPVRTLIQPPAGAVSSWPGDGNTDDIVGGNHGTLRGGATFAPGKVGQAFSFDGVDDYVEVADVPSLDITDSITIYAWIKTSATGDWWEIIGKVPGFPRPGYVLYVNPDSKIQCEIIKEFPNIAGITESTTSIEAGEWHHAACVYDGSAVKVYVNGVLEASNPYSSGISANNAPLRIGDKFDGLIEEVTIYNRALTATEIRAIYDAGSAEKVKPPPITDTILAPSGLVGWWPGDGNSNDTIGGNDGTLIGARLLLKA